MRIACVGGGPAGLYFAILMRQARPDAEITVFERNRAGDTFGWGVVFSEETLGYLEENDPATARAIRDRFAFWSDIEVRIDGESFLSGGHGFCGIERKKLLQILQERGRDLGVDYRFQTEITDPASLAGYELVLAADGVNSFARARFAEDFAPDLDPRRNKYIWFGATRPMESFLFSLRRTEHGLFWAHAYPFDGERSTFIVECTPEAWENAGLAQAGEAASLAFCGRVFADDLKGARLLSNRSAWINFTTVRNRTWRHGNLVLLGDAAHTAHFSIGSGTKLAMEDAIALVAALRDHPEDVPAALEAYEAARRPDVERIQRAAQESLTWFENIERYRSFQPLQLAFALLNRSKRVSHANLKLRDPGFVAGIDRFVAGKAAGQSGVALDPDAPPPPMFTPFRLRELVLANRVVVSPMCQYSAAEGMPDDWQMVHLGSRALGGAGLVFTEMTDVSPEGRITPGCTGLWDLAQMEGWQRITRFIHGRSEAKIGIQLGHAGRKGSTRLLWEGMDEPLAAGNWPLISSSALAYKDASQVPRAMTRADMDKVVGDFARSTELAERAGFDMVEIHMAHGYLLSCFITPLTNLRTDGYGGSIDNRMRFPLEVLDAVRAAWPAHKPLSVRISATDWAEGGLTAADRIALVRLLQARGCDLVDVSAGQTVSFARPVYGRCFQTPFSDEIRNTVGIATMTVGNISTWDEVNSIIAGGRADLCALARPHLYDPYWTLHAAAEQGWHGARWPNQYVTVQPRPRRAG